MFLGTGEQLSQVAGGPGAACKRTVRAGEVGERNERSRLAHTDIMERSRRGDATYQSKIRPGHDECN